MRVLQRRYTYSRRVYSSYRYKGKRRAKLSQDKVAMLEMRMRIHADEMKKGWSYYKAACLASGSQNRRDWNIEILIWNKSIQSTWRTGVRQRAKSRTDYTGLNQLLIWYAEALHIKIYEVPRSCTNTYIAIWYGYCREFYTFDWITGIWYCTDTVLHI